MILHIGHHFYGAGNVGDDLMLGGFLEAVPGSGGSAGGTRSELTITCCVPFQRAHLQARFPRVTWLPYDDKTRMEAIQQCDAWLGLGGSPFQCAVSRWFVEHLAQESAWCLGSGKPMYFLGVGGQDAEAYAMPEIREACGRAQRIWTREAETAETLRAAIPGVRVSAAADLSHIWLRAHRPGPAVPGRIVATLNFDYRGWDPLPGALHALGRMPAAEHLWVAQEQRALPGAEKALHESLPEDLRELWELRNLDGAHSGDHGLEAPKASMEACSLEALTRSWPTGEWLFSSRFHAALVGAWAGSRIVVIETNRKLSAVAREFGFPCLRMHEDPASLPELFGRAAPVDAGRLDRAAEAALAACGEFLSLSGLKAG